jgi:hypothetical protein
MYAVYDFLERYCNVRWFNPTEFGTDCPKQPTLTLSVGKASREPFMKYRYAAYPGSEAYDQYTGLWPHGSEGQKKWEAAAYPELHKRFENGGYTFAKRGWNMLFRLRHREGGESVSATTPVRLLPGSGRGEGQEKLFEAGTPTGSPRDMKASRRRCATPPRAGRAGRQTPASSSRPADLPRGPGRRRLFLRRADGQRPVLQVPIASSGHRRDADSPFSPTAATATTSSVRQRVAKIVGEKHPENTSSASYMTHGAAQKFSSSRTCSSSTASPATA